MNFCSVVTAPVKTTGVALLSEWCNILNLHRYQSIQGGVHCAVAAPDHVDGHGHRPEGDERKHDHDQVEHVWQGEPPSVRSSPDSPSHWSPHLASIPSLAVSIRVARPILAPYSPISTPSIDYIPCSFGSSRQLYPGSISSHLHTAKAYFLRSPECLPASVTPPLLPRLWSFLPHLPQHTHSSRLGRRATSSGRRC